MRKKPPALIILEGMDNTGKTTLAGMIEEDFGLPPTHQGGLKEYRTMFDRIDYILDNVTGVKLHDRIHFISEQVYGRVLRNFNCYAEDPRGVEQLKRVKTEVPVMVIYCRPPVENILRFGGRGQMEGVTSNSEALLVEYDKLMSQMVHDGWYVEVYDYTEPFAYENLSGLISKFIFHYKEEL